MSFILEHPNVLLAAVIVVLSVPAIFLCYGVHCALVKYCYLPHARRWCVKNGYSVVGQQAFCAIGPSGVKSEYTGFELECLDRDQRKRFVVLLVGLLGVKRVVSSADAPMSETLPRGETTLKTDVATLSSVNNPPHESATTALTIMNDDATQQILVEVRKIRSSLQALLTVGSVAVLTILAFFVWFSRPHPVPPTNVWVAVREAMDRFDFERAESLLQQVTVKYPGDYNAYAYLGNIALITGRLKQAEGYYVRADDLFPSEQNDKTLAAIQTRLVKESSVHLPDSQ
jgi:hypothetical protein